MKMFEFQGKKIIETDKGEYMELTDKKKTMNKRKDRLREFDT